MKKGFTLIELMIVVSIFTIGGAVVIGGVVALFFGVKGCQKIQEVGVQPAIEQVWSGSQTNSSSEVSK